MRLVSFIFVCLLVSVVVGGKAHAQGKKVMQTIVASHSPYVAPSRTASPSPRPARTDVEDLSFSSSTDFVENRFSTFGSSFFRYFGLTSQIPAPEAASPTRTRRVTISSAKLMERPRSDDVFLNLEELPWDGEANGSSLAVASALFMLLSASLVLFLA